jgi:hypothetical protein
LISASAKALAASPIIGSGLVSLTLRASVAAPGLSNVALGDCAA